jgi:hypothetical protein
MVRASSRSLINVLSGSAQDGDVLTGSATIPFAHHHLGLHVDERRDRRITLPHAHQAPPRRETRMGVGPAAVLADRLRGRARISGCPLA